MDPLAKYYFQPDEQKCCFDVPPIIEQRVEDYPKVVDRFFTRYYYIKPGPNPEPYTVLLHSNRICLICLAPEHPAFKEGISSITFKVGNKDRSENKVSGKRKKGGMPLEPGTALAIVTTKLGNTYKLPSCVNGKLVEVNSRVVAMPELLSIDGEGYFAIILPKIDQCDKIRSRLMTKEQYEEHKRQASQGEENLNIT